MRLLHTTIIGLILTTAALGQSTTFPAGSLPYDPRTASCEDILKHQDKNDATKLMAAGVYAHGKHMGTNCMRPDYVQAFKIYAEVGQTAQANAILKRLRSRASSGSASAKRAIQKLEKAGLI